MIRKVFIATLLCAVALAQPPQGGPGIHPGPGFVDPMASSKTRRRRDDGSSPRSLVEERRGSQEPSDSVTRRCKRSSRSSRTAA